ncbi:MAG: anaerobic ribonucleoside-triphosphate reductase activating protein [Deltaproteobacteria bacterium]|nr:anaerobic ribonucleoside-triphosphate reductase activating protein [Deltaproteobacteria bacterium]
MLIGALINLSTVDYPSKISAVVFTLGCNFSCPFCHNPDLVSASRPRLAESEVMAFLDKRKHLLEAVVISGGEPTLQSDLFDFLGQVKALGYAIKLDTNGSNPQVIEKLIEAHLIDYLALDLKADLLDFPPIFLSKNQKSQDIGQKILKSLNILRDRNFPSEFRSTCAYPFITAQSIEKLAQLAQGQIPWYLQRYRPETVLNPPYMAAYAKQPTDQDLIHFQKLAAPYLPCRIRE